MRGFPSEVRCIGCSCLALLAKVDACFAQEWLDILHYDKCYDSIFTDGKMEA